jgi:hypothetical protein
LLSPGTPKEITCAAASDAYECSVLLPCRSALSWLRAPLSAGARISRLPGRPGSRPAGPTGPSHRVLSPAGSMAPCRGSGRARTRAGAHQSGSGYPPLPRQARARHAPTPSGVNACRQAVKSARPLSGVLSRRGSPG